MKSIILLFTAVIICSGLGRVLLSRLKTLALSPLERFAYGTAFGLGIAAYGVLALGLAGQLTFWPVTLLWVALALFGIVGSIRNFQDIVQIATRRAHSHRGHPSAFSLSLANLIAPATMLVLAAALIFALCACFQPPAGHEWDVLAYHLADPKVFLSLHRITMLPTEHHSNFPFLMEMLYCVGLLYDGYALANMFHLLMGVLTVAAVLGFCRRVMPMPAGWAACQLLVTTPIYLWECCVAYVEVGFGLYVTLGLFAAVMAIEATKRSRTDSSGMTKDTERQRNLREWGTLAGIAMGFALGVKYLALIPFVMTFCLLLWRRVPFRSCLAFCGIAMAVGSPWYIKSLMFTNNPVYPFFFRAFPRSVNWSADRAAPYQSEQSSFGFIHGTTTPAKNPVLTPWRLTTNPERYTNLGDYTFMALTGGLYAAFILPLVFMRGIPRHVVDLLLLLSVQLLAWFLLAQVVRYLVSMMPLAAVVAAYGMIAFSRIGKRRMERGRGIQLRLLPTLTALVVIGQTQILLWSIWTLPTSTKAAHDSGMMLTSLSFGDVLKNATEPDTHDDYLTRRLDLYESVNWINRNTYAGEGIVLYDEARGFYLDRPYLWGNREHSAFIPYDRMHDGLDLSRWLRTNGYKYVLINLNWSPMRRATDNPSGHELEFLRSWYIESPVPGEWRFLLADAMRRGLWVPTAGTAHGVVVMEVTWEESMAPGMNGHQP